MAGSIFVARSAQTGLLDRCFVGEILVVGISNLKDVDGDFVTSLSGPDSINCSLNRDDGTEIRNDDLTYVAGTSGTWTALVPFPSEAARVNVHFTVSVGGTIDKYTHRIIVESFA